jgi:excisionase family DNA binding protein
MPTFLIKEAARLLGVSHDTLRRWADAGRIETTSEPSGRLAIDGAELARFAQELAASAYDGKDRAVVAQSVRNRFTGLVTHVPLSGPRRVRGQHGAGRVRLEHRAGHTTRQTPAGSQARARPGISASGCLR